MANPSPPSATYPLMGTRVGYSDGNPLTTDLLNQLAAYLVAQDGNGNAQQIASLRVGPNAFVYADPAGTFWLTYNAYYDTGSSQWWALNESLASFAIQISPSGIAFCTSPANTAPFAWQSVDNLTANGLHSIVSINSEIVTIDGQIAGLTGALANAGAQIFASITAAQASSLINGAFYYVAPSANTGGALDLYQKISGSSSAFIATLPALSYALNTPSFLQHSGETSMALSLSQPSGIQYASTVLASYALQLPGGAPDGTVCGFVCSQAILALTVNAADSATVYGAAAATIGNQPVHFEYKASPPAWYPTSR